MTSNNKFIVSSGVDCTLRVWNVENQMPVAVLTEHTSTVGNILITNGNQYLVQQMV